MQLLSLRRRDTGRWSGKGGTRMEESFSHRRRDNIKQRQRGVNKTTIISGLREGGKHKENVARDQRVGGGSSQCGG